MKINVILFGSTGMIGKSVLFECLESEIVESVLVLTGSPSKSVIHSLRKSSTMIFLI